MSRGSSSGSRYSQLFRRGLPFVGGLAVLAFMAGSLADIRYRLSRMRAMESNAYYDASAKLPESQRLLKDMLGRQDIDRWDNVRGPRPWENSRAMQAEQRNSGR